MIIVLPAQAPGENKNDRIQPPRRKDSEQRRPPGPAFFCSSHGSRVETEPECPVILTREAALFQVHTLPTAHWQGTLEWGQTSTLSVQS